MRKIIAGLLTYQARRFLNKNKPKVVVIAGSVGKTSTTQAISTILEKEFKVRRTIANYNTDIGVPCSIFGRTIPTTLKNPTGWVWMLIKNEISLLLRKNIEILVLEIGTEKPGELEQYKWLNPDIAVVTAVAPEHMEFFDSIEDVAKEELSVTKYSAKTWVNRNMVDKKHFKITDKKTVEKYGRKDLKKFKLKPDDLGVVGLHSIDAVVAGLIVGKELGVSEQGLKDGAKAVIPQQGRMQLLDGKKNTVLIDDTYNSSSQAVIAALDYLYSVDAPQRIALLGNMNELGDFSRKEHLSIGEYCDEKKLDLVVTLGVDANKYTSAAAVAHGCKVQEATTPYEAAKIIEEYMVEGACILLKGSQNGVFAEEATKMLLANIDDQDRLVRQSAFWQIKKLQTFGKREA